MCSNREHLFDKYIKMWYINRERNSIPIFKTTGGAVNGTNQRYAK